MFFAEVDVVRCLMFHEKRCPVGYDKTVMVFMYVAFLELLASAA